MGVPVSEHSRRASRRPRADGERTRSAILRVAAISDSPVRYRWYEGITGDTSTPLGTTNPYTTTALTQPTAFWVIRQMQPVLEAARSQDAQTRERLRTQLAALLTILGIGEADVLLR